MTAKVPSAFPRKESKDVLRRDLLRFRPFQGARSAIECARFILAVHPKLAGRLNAAKNADFGAANYICYVCIETTNVEVITIYFSSSRSEEFMGHLSISYKGRIFEKTRT